MSDRSSLRRAIRTALATGLTATSCMAVSTTMAQDEDVLEQERQVVTGSRILRTGIETSAPVTVITREQIDASGHVSISQVLRQLPQNTFGSFHEQSGRAGGAIGNAAVDLRGLGSQRTLVLLDGRRTARSPGFDAEFENLNVIPFSAVERIEVLRDGASAIYGSDAIAGVINIILRKEFEGLHLAAQMSRPTQDGGDEDAASLFGGVSSSKGNITFGVDYSRKAMLFNRQRDFASVGLSVFGFPGSFAATGPDLSPMGPGFPRFIGTFADPRCPLANSPLDATDFDGVENYFRQGNNTDPEFPDSVAVGFPPFPGTVESTACFYNYAATSAEEARIKRQSVFINANFEVSDDVTFFTRVIASQNETFGRYAATPQVGGNPFTATMAATNPNNPTQGLQFTLPDFDVNFNLLTTSSVYNGPFDLSQIFYRNVPGSFRDTIVDDDVLDLLAGFEGSLDIFTGAEWEIGLQHSRAKALDTSVGLADRTGLQAVIDDGSFDIFGVNGPTSSTIARTFVVDGFTDAETDMVAGDALLSFDWGDLPAGPVSWAWGVEYQDIDYQRNFDTIANQGNIDGSAGGTDVKAKRAVFSAFGEALVPILANLEIDLALRYDKYNDFGDTTNPKVGIGYRPVESLLLRGTYGTGFRAPEFGDLYDPNTSGITSGQDIKRCIAQGDSNNNGIPDVDENPDQFPFGSPCGLNIFEIIDGGNSGLGPEESENWTAGFVWSPMPELSFDFGYYDIEIENEVETIGIDSILEREATGNPFFESLVVRDAMDRIIAVFDINQNVAGRRTEGLDLDATYRFGFESIGDFNATVSFTHVLEYEFALLPGEPFGRLADLEQADTRGTIGIGWQRGNFAGQLDTNYISTVTDGNGGTLSAWTTFDLQFSWDAPWNGKLTLGARNLTNEDPPLWVDEFGEVGFYSTQIHDVYGRIPYIRYDQDL